jgi:murein L,D-transpeptidase YafK
VLVFPGLDEWARRVCGELTPPAFPEKVDRIVVAKSYRAMALCGRGVPVGAYRVGLGKNPFGAKVRRGDKKTPEGRYFIEEKVPESSFHLALRVSYPNEEDRARARELGVDPGGDIMIHGLPGGAKPSLQRTQWRLNWTNGCIAVNDREIERIYALVRVGTPVDIRP